MDEKKKRGRGIQLGLRAKILGISLPVTVVMVVLLIVIAYTISRKNIMESSEVLLNTSAKDQAHQIESWLNRKLDEVKTVKFDIEKSGALTDDELLQQKLDSYANLDSAFAGGFYVADLNGNVMKAESNTATISSVTSSIWFKEGLTRMNPNYTSVYTDENGNKIISACSMFNDLENPRVFATNLSIDSVNIIVNSSVSMSDAESLLVDKTNGNVLVARDASLISKDIESSSDEFFKSVAKKIKDADYTQEALNKNQVVIREISGSNWLLVSYIPLSTITSNVDALRNTMIIIAVVFLAIVIVASVLNVTLAVKPLKVLTKKIKAMSEGDFTIEINAKGNDEIAEIQRSVKSFVRNMRDMINEINEITESLKEQADASSQISLNMNGSSVSQAESMISLNETVEQISNSVNEIAESATNLSSVVSDTNADSESIGQQIQETVSISQRGRGDMQRVDDAMRVIRESIASLVEAIDKVGNASQEITGITQLISDISEQTSLLSLNASIEAARAGEAGKGFAVVATEISKLAQNTAQSAGEIDRLIGQIDHLIADVIKQVNVSETNINDSAEYIKIAANTFDAIFGSVQAVQDNIKRMVGEMQIVNNVAMDVSAIAEEQAASTLMISDTSETMVEQANNLADQSKNVSDSAELLTKTSENLTRQMSKFNV